MAKNNLPLPHPHLEQLAPRSHALYGVDYFHAELARRRPPPSLPPPALPPPASSALPSPAEAGGSLPVAIVGGKRNLPGIVEGMTTYNIRGGLDAQVAWDLKHKPLCKPSCPGYKSNSKCSASCEQAIIRAAKKVRMK